MDNNTALVIIVALVVFWLVGVKWASAWKDRVYYTTKASRDRARAELKAVKAQVKNTHPGVSS